MMLLLREGNVSLPGDVILGVVDVGKYYAGQSVDAAGGRGRCVERYPAAGWPRNCPGTRMCCPCRLCESPRGAGRGDCEWVTVSG